MQQPHADLSASWARPVRHLTAARVALPPEVGGQSLTFLDEYLAQNELGLALDVLAAVAEESGAGQECWQELRLAVEEMALAEDDDTHGPTVRLVLGHTPDQG